MSKKYFALLLMAVMMLFAVNAVAAEGDLDWDSLKDYEKCLYPTSHTAFFEDVQVITPATCTGQGEKIVKCSECVKVGYSAPRYAKVTIPALNHDVQPVAAVPATCEEGGNTAGEACTRCDAMTTWTVTAPLGHDMRKGAVVIAGSCKVEQQVRWYCSRCDYTELRSNGFVHTFVEKTVPGDCYTLTWVGQVCSKCNEKGDGAYLPDSQVHAYVLNQATYKPATCKAEGYQELVCSKCDYKNPNTTIPKLNHNMVETGEIVPATCEEAGGLLMKCTVCGETELNQIKNADGTPVYPANGKHQWGKHFAADNTELKYVAATCKASAYWLDTCKKCGTTTKRYDGIDQAVRASHNNWKVRVVKAATCTTDGVGELSCSWCGESQGYGIIPMSTAHTYKTTSITAATCKEAGKEYRICTKCNHTDIRELDKIPYHVYEVKVVRGKCNATGDANKMQKGYVCTVCGTTYGLQPIDGTNTPHEYVLDTENKAYIPVEPCSEKPGMNVLVCKDCKDTKYEPTFGNHDWEVTTIFVKPSCGQAGGYQKVCKLCGAKDVEVIKDGNEDKYPAVGQHTWQKVDSKSVKSNCHTIGYDFKQCTNCGATQKFSHDDFDADTHDLYVVRTVAAADCNNTGIVVKACKHGCKLEGDNKEIYVPTPVAHTWVVKETKEPTCEAGYKKVVCSKCNATETVTLKPIRAHKYVDAMKPATCVENAEYGSFCEFCWAKEGVGAYKEVMNSKLPHTEVNVVVTRKPSCGVKGEYTFDCTVCHQEKLVGEIDSLGEHTYVKGGIVDATCTKNGGYLYTCSKCQDKYIDVIMANGQPKYPAMGHLLVKDATGAAKWFDAQGTCQTAAYKYNQCSRCEEKLNKTPTGSFNLDNHSDLKLKNTLKKASCTEIGVGEYECKGCHKVIYKVISAGHAWDKGTVIVEGNCGTGAQVLKKCTVCGATETKTEKPSGKHVWEYDLTNEAKDVIYKKCTVCGTCVVTDDLRDNQDDQTPCALYGHTEVAVAAKAPTCTEKGLTAGTKCSVCNKVLKAQEEIAATGHSYAEGKCTVCGAEDPNCAACEHEYGAPVYGFNADLTMVIAKYTCTKCGDVKVVDVRPIK